MGAYEYRSLKMTFGIAAYFRRLLPLIRRPGPGRRCWRTHLQLASPGQHEARSVIYPFPQSAKMDTGHKRSLVAKRWTRVGLASLHSGRNFGSLRGFLS